MPSIRSKSPEPCDPTCLFCSHQCRFAHLNIIAPVRSSSLSELLKSNNLPNEVDERLYKGRLDVHAAQIEFLDGYIEEIVQLRESIAQSMADCKAVLSPIRRLSTDVAVLGNIFGWHLINCESDPDFHSLDTKHGVHALSQVCSDWRVAAFEHPELWSTIKVQYRHYQPARAGTYTYMIGLSNIIASMLIRSGSRPLSITISGNPIIAEMAGLHTDHLLTTLLHYAARWEALRWESAPDGLQHLLPMMAHLKSLQRITIANPIDFAFVTQRIPQSVKLPSRLSRSLQLSIVGYLDLDIDTFPRSNVTYYSGVFTEDARREGSDALKVLQSMPNVTTYVVRVEGKSPFKQPTAIPGPVTRITWMSLHTLVITNRPAHIASVGELFGFITAPLLRCLQTIMDPFSHNEFHAFLKRSKCILSQLTLDFNFVSSITADSDLLKVV